MLPPSALAPSAARFAAAFALCLQCAIVPLWAAPASARIAIHSIASGHYAPPSIDGAEGSTQTYVVTDGGYAAGTARDGKLARLDFDAIAAPLATALAQQGFRPATPDEQPLLHLVVEWGRTKPAVEMNLEISANRIGELRRAQSERQATPGYFPTHQQESLRNEMVGEAAKMHLGAANRDYTTWDNAMLLGYADDLYALSQAPRIARPWKHQQALMNDLTSERLYLIVRAFIFDAGDPAAAPQARLVWLTRLSIRDEGPSFPAQLEIMLPFAARYFGRSTGELIRATSLKDLK